MDTKQRIRELMKKRGWTEYRLAKEAGLAQSTISNMFKRHNAPTLPTLETICKAFDITLVQFFSEGDDPALMTKEQRELFSKWNTMTNEQKKILLALMDVM